MVVLKEKEVCKDKEMWRKLVCCTVVVPGEFIRVYYGVRNAPIEPPTSTTRRPLIYPTFAPAPVREDQELDTNFINRRPYKFIKRIKTIPKTYVSGVLYS
uniref:(California timema) hypothetical protein n=1 Tax=Timema californicum TaxID=61474 RepID=A0A7R9P4W5_TIMCA|nr:unnamed protein product [Timema californicum]